MLPNLFWGCVSVIFSKKKVGISNQNMEMISSMLRVCSILVVVLMQQNLMASALPASSTSAGESCDSVGDVMTSLKLAHTAMVSDSPVSG